MSGPLGPGAESTTISQYKLWQKRVNDAGGIMLKKFNKKVPIELVGYDDQGKPDELLKLTERLIQQDKVDMILSPYATHMNLASAPIVNKYEYPVIMTTATTTKTYELGPKWPYAFWNISQPKESTRAARQDARRAEEGRQDQGPRRRRSIRLSSTASRCTRRSSTPPRRTGSRSCSARAIRSALSDLQPLIREAMAANAGRFIAFSYPPDTFMLTEQMQDRRASIPQLMYRRDRRRVPGLKGKFGNKVNGILVYGGIDPSAPGMDEYNKAHQAMFNRDVGSRRGQRLWLPCRSRSRRSRQVGEIDRKKIRDAIASGTFKTAVGRAQVREPAQRQSLGGRPVAERRGRRRLPGQQGRRASRCCSRSRMVVTQT